MRVLSVALALWLAACAGTGSDSRPGGGAGPGGGTSGGGAGSGAGGGGSSSSDPGPTSGEDPSVTGIVAAHNAARAAVQPAPAVPLPPLSWSEDAFAQASAWAARCRYGHNPDLADLGENIFATSGTATAQEVVARWVGESSQYDYATGRCSGTCGHYTQVVWRATTGVGCAAETCTTGSPFAGGGTWQFWVCDYAPAGNIDGERPY